MKPFTVKNKKKLAVVVFKPDNTHLLVFKRCVKREFKKLLNIILETLAHNDLDTRFKGYLILHNVLFQPYTSF